MNKRRLIILISFFLIFILFGFFILLFIKKDNNTSNEKNQEISTNSNFTNKNTQQEQKEIPSGKISIPTPKGDVILNDPASDPVLNISGDPLVTRTDDYDIVYYSEEQSFVITLSNEDIQLARDKAEQDFLKTLGVSETQACKLKVSLVITSDINKELAGNNYGLSFCPNGKPFPPK